MKESSKNKQIICEHISRKLLNQNYDHQEFIDFANNIDLSEILVKNDETDSLLTEQATRAYERLNTGQNGWDIRSRIYGDCILTLLGTNGDTFQDRIQPVSQFFEIIYQNRTDDNLILMVYSLTRFAKTEEIIKEFIQFLKSKHANDAVAFLRWKGTTGILNGVTLLHYFSQRDLDLVFKILLEFKDYLTHTDLQTQAEVGPYNHSAIYQLMTSITQWPNDFYETFYALLQQSPQLLRKNELNRYKCLHYKRYHEIDAGLFRGQVDHNKENNLCFYVETRNTFLDALEILSNHDNVLTEEIIKNAKEAAQKANEQRNQHAHYDLGIALLNRHRLEDSFELFCLIPQNSPYFERAMATIQSQFSLMLNQAFSNPQLRTQYLLKAFQCAFKMQIEHKVKAIETIAYIYILDATEMPSEFQSVLPDAWCDVVNEHTSAQWCLARFDEIKQTRELSQRNDVLEKENERLAQELRMLEEELGKADLIGDLKKILKLSTAEEDIDLINVSKNDLNKDEKKATLNKSQ